MMERPADELSALDQVMLLPPDDPERRRFEACLPNASVSVQAHWEALAREDRLLREALARGPVPEKFVDTLLALPQALTPAITPARRSWKDVSVPWPIAAAVVLIVLGAGVYGYWDMQRPTVMVSLPAPPKEAVEKATLLAVANSAAADSLDVQGADVKTVAAALQKRAGRNLAFDVSIPAVPADFHLLGGSVVSFGGQAAIYTRWETAGKIYSLFQIPPQSVGLPRNFATVSATPASPKQTVRVTLWSGQSQTCTWVSVSDPTLPQDPFCGESY